VGCGQTNCLKAGRISERQMLIPKAGRRLFSRLKRFLNHRTVEPIKDLLLGGYQRLPKASSFLGLACREPKIHESFLSHQSFHSDFYVESMKESDHLSKPNDLLALDDNSAQTESAPKDDGRDREDIMVIGSFLNFGNIRNGRLVDNSIGGEGIGINVSSTKALDGSEKMNSELRPPSASLSLAESKAEACVIFERTLKEMVMEHDDPQDWLDIHEFLYYYSRLTCPFYIDMVNTFFMDICRG